MKIIVTGSLGNISKPLTQKLVKAGHEVTVISSKADKTAEIEALGARAAIGSLADVNFLTQTFTGADAVYTMVPPSYTAENFRQYIGDTARNYAQAIKNAGIKQVVNLSSTGAHLNGGTGTVAGLHDSELIFNQLDGVAVKHLRAGYFYTNFYNSIVTIQQGFISGNFGFVRLLMVSTDDVAEAAAEEFQNGFAGKSVRYVISDEQTAAETTKILGNAVGKPDLKWVELTDEQVFNGLIANGLNADLAQNITEMGAGVRSGIFWGDFDATNSKVTGKTKLEDFAKEFAAEFARVKQG